MCSVSGSSQHVNHSKVTKAGSWSDYVFKISDYLDQGVLASPITPNLHFSFQIYKSES